MKKIGVLILFIVLLTGCTTKDAKTTPSSKQETDDIKATFSDLKNAGVDIVTIGQYIQPSKQHLEVAKYYTLEEFEELKKLAKKAGIKNYQIGPLVRSSYHAFSLFEKAEM